MIDGLPTLRTALLASALAAPWPSAATAQETSEAQSPQETNKAEPTTSSEPVGPREPPPPAEGTVRHTIMSALTVDLPAGWREFLPNEALDHGGKLPFAIANVRPNVYEIFGDVDKWVAEGFDGEAVAIARSDFERPADSSNLQSLIDASNGTDRGGNQREVLDSRIDEVGFFDHPALLLDVRYDDKDFGAFRLFETHASTSGDEYVVVHLLSDERLRSDPDAVGRIRSTLRFVAPPKDPEELPDRLLNAALVGAFIAIVLLVVRKMQRARPAQS